jgi:biotin synthase-like enzyme
VVFPIIGAENLSVQALSANLKTNGHKTHIVMDPALFDDKNFLCYGWMERLISQKNRVISEILDLEPELVAFSVMTPTFQWACDVTEGLKKLRPDLPVVFGGVHPTLVPDVCLKNSQADAICVGEGDDAIVELADAIADGEDRTDIQSLWFKREDKIIQNPRRHILEDLNHLPFYDKEAHEPWMVPHNNMLMVMSRGCPFECSFCTLYKYAQDADEQGVDRVRLRSPELAVKEIKLLKEKYGYTWIEFKDNTFTANKKWLREFLPLLKKEVGLPFKCFVHPSTLTDEIVKLLKDSGCWGVQMGVESLSQTVRAEILNRHESDATIERAFRLLDEAGLKYSTDYILGLPKENEQDLERAARIFIGLKACHRVSPFLLAYLPKHPITEIAHKLGILSDQDIHNLEQGGHDHYLGLGSMRERGELRKLLGFKYFFRLIPHLPRPVNKLILKTRLYKVFPFIPFFGEFVMMVDFLFALVINEPDIRSYAKHYLWTLPRVLTNTYYSRRRGPTKPATRTPSEQRVETLAHAK